MPRPLRVHVSGGFYHATLRGNHRQDVFRHARERQLLNLIVKRALEKHGASIHAFCWMTNHLHFLIRVDSIPLGRTMQRIASEYARAFQANLDTTGHLFEARYYATLIDTDTYLLEALRYVHQNPVRGGIVARAADYRWSSHRDYAGATTHPWMTTDFILSLFSTDRARAIALYGAFVEATPEPAMSEQLAALEDGAPLLGGKEFLARHTAATHPVITLEVIIAAAVRHFGVPRPGLRSPSRTARLVAARAWITHTALATGAASLASIARELNRDESTLRYAMRTRPAPLPNDPALGLLVEPGDE
jgi:REP element-mobilizing transposase RayT